MPTFSDLTNPQWWTAEVQTLGGITGLMVPAAPALAPGAIGLGDIVGDFAGSEATKGIADAAAAGTSAVVDGVTNFITTLEIVGLLLGALVLIVVLRR